MSSIRKCSNKHSFNEKKALEKKMCVKTHTNTSWTVRQTNVKKEKEEKNADLKCYSCVWQFQYFYLLFRGI